MDKSVPPSHHLLITTASAVYKWTHEGLLNIFTSRSGSIVTSSSNNGETLAIADSTGVLLHDFSGTLNRSYVLKNKDGPLLLLHYEPIERSLFIVTTAQGDVVQLFAINKGESIELAPSHPSQISIVAVSPNLDTFVSNSDKPSTAFVTFLKEHQAPVHLQPRCTSATVVAAVYHPTIGNIFALAFANGTIAAYDTSRLYAKNNRNPTRTPLGEIGHIPNSQASTAPAINTKISLAFIPQRQCTTVSVGTDGICCIVDFEKTSSRPGGVGIVRQWNIERPASSLSIMNVSNWPDAVVRSLNNQNTSKCIIAVGGQGGQVMLYSLSGEPIAHRNIRDGSKILSLEWVKSVRTTKKPLQAPRIAGDRSSPANDDVPGTTGPVVRSFQASSDPEKLDDLKVLELGLASIDLDSNDFNETQSSISVSPSVPPRPTPADGRLAQQQTQITELQTIGVRTHQCVPESSGWQLRKEQANNEEYEIDWTNLEPKMAVVPINVSSSVTQTEPDQLSRIENAIEVLNVSLGDLRNDLERRFADLNAVLSHGGGDQRQL